MLKVCQNISNIVINLGTMGLDLEEELSRLNARLKAGGTRVTVERRGKTLLFRGTFPPKPQSDKLEPYQQRLFLGYRFSVAGLRQAESTAKKISAELELRTFNWQDWLDDVDEQPDGSIASWLEKFENHHWTVTPKTRKALATWRNYQNSFSKFRDKSEPLTLDAILTAVASTNPDSGSRNRTCLHLAMLGKFAGIRGIEKVEELRGRYSGRTVNPRNLPSDEVIARAVESIKMPGWKWLVGMLATYGLRTHEVFSLDFSEFPIIRVLEDTKTGERIVYPIYPEWAVKWRLKNVVYPEISKEHAAARVSDWFRRGKLGKTFGLKAYDLRHSYARRCFEFDIPTNRAAKLMGHSELVHIKTYRAWIDEKYYRQKFKLDIFGEGKPKAPILGTQE